MGRRWIILLCLTLLTGGLQTAHALELPIQKGWNLVAMPINQDSYISNFINSNDLEAQGFKRIWSWEKNDQDEYTWFTYPQFEDIPELELIRPNQGYWIQADAPFTIDTSQFGSSYIYPPYPLTDQQVLDLLSGDGFNLVGFSLLKQNNGTVPVEEVFPNVDKITVWSWVDGNWAIWHPTQSVEELNEYFGGTDFVQLEQLEEGRGYWVNSANMEIIDNGGSDGGTGGSDGGIGGSDGGTGGSDGGTGGSDGGTGGSDGGTGGSDGGTGGSDGGTGGSDGGTGGSDGGTGGEVCESDLDYFDTEIWQPTLSTSCIGCHISGGIAGGTRMVLNESTEAGFLTDNFDTVKAVALIDSGDLSLWIAKPTNTTPHGGGPRFQVDGSTYQSFVAMVERFKNPTECTEPETPTTTPPAQFSKVIESNDQETLRKAALSLTGALPIPELNAAVGSETVSLDQALDMLMEEQSFYARLMEIWNDLFLTEKYNSSTRGISLLSSSDYPDRTWYNEYNNETDRDKYYYMREATNRGVAQAPLELIAHIVKNNLPFTEILTADYMMANPMSARTYGISDYAYADVEGTDYRDIDTNAMPVQIEGIPHAGILTDPMFLNRFPTTATNRNRHRSRMIYQFFLDTDLLRLSNRPVDSNAVGGHNPTLFNSQCNICHALMDPIAGTFQNWDSRGRFRPETWYQDMRQPGMSEENIVPYNQYEQSLQWLGQQIANDPRFPKSIVKKMYTGLTGKMPLLVPDDMDAADYQDQKTAYDIQSTFFNAAALAFKNDDFNLKTVVKQIILSPYYRAKGIEVEAGESNDSPFYRSVDSSRLLTPEMLDRKIEAILGYPWIYYSTRRNLLTTSRYRTLYGGHDSDSITKRIDSPNGVMTAVQKRMSNEMSCVAVARDFTIQDRSERLLFPFVESGFEPEDAYGFPIPMAEEAIRQNIRYLHGHILGESLALDDEEIERIFNLFYQTWKLGKSRVESDEKSDYLMYDCRAEKIFGTNEYLPEEIRVRKDSNYTIRAWKAVVTYLLRNYQFLYE